MMLIERVKVTLQAMLWSKDWLEKQGTLKQAEKDAEEGQSNLDINPGVEFEDVFIAKLGLLLPPNFLLYSRQLSLIYICLSNKAEIFLSSNFAF